MIERYSFDNTCMFLATHSKYTRIALDLLSPPPANTLPFRLPSLRPYRLLTDMVIAYLVNLEIKDAGKAEVVKAKLVRQCGSLDIDER